MREERVTREDNKVCGTCLWLRGRDWLLEILRKKIFFFEVKMNILI